ncbi:MAG: hypothetical protein NTW98_02135 [Candidatus Nomurabacteria bacterium]|nr:hypothetical protein [Candidatus Nomurabacteria bacterium]
MDPEIIKKIPHRNEGGMLQIGEDGDGNVSELIPLEDFGMVVVTRKSVWRIMLADDIDPKRNNVNIPRHVQERLLSYGSDDPVVGRTLLQAKELFLGGHLPGTVDKQKGMQLALSFMKELGAMNDEIKKLAKEYKKIQNRFKGKLKEDGSLVLPTLKNLERRAKELIQNIDHMGGMVIDILRLFPIEIPQKNPLGKLIEQADQKLGSDHLVVSAISELKEKMGWLRYLRSDMEHPDESGVVSFENYSMNESAHIKLPTVKHTRDQSPFGSIDIMQFAVESQESIMSLFETALVLLSDFYAEDFAGDKVFVRNVHDKERTETNPHMNYRYDINWTK